MPPDFSPPMDLPAALHSQTQVNAPATQQRPGADTGGSISDATSILQSTEVLALVALLLRADVKDKTYRLTPIGRDAQQFLEALEWEGAKQNTLDSYETTLARLSFYFGDRQLSDLTKEDLRGFLVEHWGESASATRRQRLAAVKSFCRWALDEGHIAENRCDKIKSPRVENVERQAYSPDVIDELRDAQPTLRDQICIQLLGRLALRRNELRLLQVGDFDLARGTVRIHGKGGKVVIMPIGFKALKLDLEIHLMARGGDEYLLNPQGDETRPMTSAGVHLWFKRCLDRAGLPSTIKMHEMRHSAADNLWRKTGNLTIAQQLLRHSSPATTAGYLHPTREDLELAMGLE